MKTLHTLFFVLLVTAGFGQSFLNGARIKDKTIDGEDKLVDESVKEQQIAPGAISPAKLSSSVGRPVVSGVLSDFALVFDQIEEVYTLPVTADIPLTLAGSGHVAHSKITITAVGDGSHVLSFPLDWIQQGDDVYNPAATQKIELIYDGVVVTWEVLWSKSVVISNLVIAVMVEGTDDLTMMFDNPVTITTAGWSVTASGGAATVSSVVSGSGTSVVVFDLSRNITSGEDMTISYNPATGSTVSSTGNELVTITDRFVDTGEGEPPPELFDFVVDTEAELIAAAQQALTGQRVAIKECTCGDYRVTVTPTNHGVIFQKYPGDEPRISGLNVVNTSWTAHSGQIYKTTISLPITGFASTITSNTSLLANQIFKDGAMQFQARWPKVSAMADLLDRDKNRHRTQMSSGFIGQSSLTDTGLPAINLTGASIWVQGWFIAQTRTITADNGSTLSYAALDQNPKFQRWYYVTNDLELLTDEKEWHYEGGVLYFRQTGGGSPTGVEYKARNWGFDLRGKDNTQIIGITFIGCEPATGDTGSDGNTIDNVRATYMNHAFMQVDPDQIYNSAKQTGIKLIGNNNTIKNSEFQYASSQVIWAGPGTLVQNNLVSDVAYDGNYGAFVTPWQDAGNIKILYNTGSRFGRSAIDGGYDEGHNHHNLEIGYNNFHTYLMLNADGGCLYFARGVRLDGSRIHHNWLHDNDVGDDWSGSQGAQDYDGIHVNLYFDQGTGPTTVDHNVMWKGGVADYYSQVISTTQNIYNNTFAHTGQRESYIVAQTTPNDVVRNNIFVNTVNINWTSQRGNVAYSIVPTTHSNFNSNNNILTNSPLFVGPLETGAGYMIQSGSPARNAGMVITGITDGYEGAAPDMGAYEYNQPWTPGYNAVTTSEYIIDNADFQYTGTGWTHGTGQLWTPPPTNSLSYSPTMGAYAEADFTGTTVSLYSEKRFNHGIIEIKIDGVRVDCDPGTGGIQDCDLYSVATATNTQLIGTWTVAAGEHEFRATKVGGNASCTEGCNNMIDYLLVAP